MIVLGTTAPNWRPAPTLHSASVDGGCLYKCRGIHHTKSSGRGEICDRLNESRAPESRGVEYVYVGLRSYGVRAIHRRRGGGGGASGCRCLWASGLRRSRVGRSAMRAPMVRDGDCNCVSAAPRQTKAAINRTHYYECCQGRRRAVVSDFRLMISICGVGGLGAGLGCSHGGYGSAGTQPERRWEPGRRQLLGWGVPPKG